MQREEKKTSISKLTWSNFQDILLSGGKKSKVYKSYMLYYLCVKKGENINTTISVCILILRKENPGRINQDLTKMVAYGEGRNKLRGQK